MSKQQQPTQGIPKMNYTKIRGLGKEMNKPEKKRVSIRDELHEARIRTKELYSDICQGLTFKQYEKWTRYPSAERFAELHKVTKDKRLLAAAKEYMALTVRIAELNSGYTEVLGRLGGRDSLQLVVSNPYSWYELRVRKLNQTASTRIPRPNPAGLKLVG